MLGNWMKRKIEIIADKNAKEDLERFVLSLQGQSAQEIGLLVAIATVLRSRLEADGKLPESVLGVGMPAPEREQADIQLHFSNLVRAFRANTRLRAHHKRNEPQPQESK